jgi:hypothetical protein
LGLGLTDRSRAAQPPPPEPRAGLLSAPGSTHPDRSQSPQGCTERAARGPPGAPEGGRKAPGMASRHTRGGLRTPSRTEKRSCAVREACVAAGDSGGGADSVGVLQRPRRGGACGMPSSASHHQVYIMILMRHKDSNAKISGVTTNPPESPSAVPTPEVRSRIETMRKDVGLSTPPGNDYGFRREIRLSVARMPSTDPGALRAPARADTWIAIIAR